MSKKVLVISTSLRNGSNSEILASEFANGARDSGNVVDVISLQGKKISFCVGCLACQKTGACIIKDDVSEIAEKMLVADVITFATPIYFYEMAGQMKTLLDRLNPMFSKSYQFHDIYLLTSAADGNETAMDGAIHGLQGFIDCFEQSRLAGVVRGIGLEASGDINCEEKNNIRTLAYEMGKSIGLDVYK